MLVCSTRNQYFLSVFTYCQWNYYKNDARKCVGDNDQCSHNPQELIEEIFQLIWQIDVRFVHIFGESIGNLWRYNVIQIRYYYRIQIVLPVRLVLSKRNQW